MTRKLAVITGASTGIGLELAKQCAEHDFDLIIGADEDMAGASRELEAKGVTVDAEQVDLATAEGVDRLADAAVAGGRQVDALIVNAGVGFAGPFVETNLDDQLKMIDLNITGAVRLTHRLLPAMVGARSGRLLFTSSQAGTMPTAYQAVYGGTKAFLYQFALALREELKDSGVTVTALLPGPTETEFFRRAGMQNTLAGRMPKDDPALVARQGFEAMMAGKKTALGGNPLTQAMTVLNKVTPDMVKSKMYAALAKPRS